MTFVANRCKRTHGVIGYRHKKQNVATKRVFATTVLQVATFFLVVASSCHHNLVCGDNLMQHASTSWRLAICGDRYLWREPIPTTHVSWHMPFHCNNQMLRIAIDMNPMATTIFSWVTSCATNTLFVVLIYGNNSPTVNFLFPAIKKSRNCLAQVNESNIIGAWKVI
jgi:hypothetical protein